jgi:hypothetical protein
METERATSRAGTPFEPFETRIAIPVSRSTGSGVR